MQNAGADGRAAAKKALDGDGFERWAREIGQSGD